jgi:DNA processing protein
VSIGRLGTPPKREPQACADCLRRTWLVARLAGRIELARHAGRGGGAGALRELLALPDATLLAAIAGQERHRIARELEQVEPTGLRLACARAGLTAVCRHDRDYPARLLHLDDAPAVLHVTEAGASHLANMAAGTLAGGADAVAIVGTRRASADGLEIARALGRGLAAAGVTVVSGMALGADSAAHAGALEAGGATVAVLACGADVPYPPSKRTLYARIVRAGCVVSELPPGFGPHRWCFPARNRIIAALAQMTVVVEAAERSGSLITAELAADLGRDVGAVPGTVTSWRAAGTNALLRDGATLVRDARDVLDAIVGVAGEAAPTDAQAGRHRPAGRHRAAGLEPRLADLLDAVEAGRDTVAALAGHPAEADAIVAGLTELELLGLLRRAAGGRYVRAVAS